MTSKLAAMQARFQQKQMQEKEEKLVRLYENQQQRAFERVGRGSAGSNTSIGSTGGGKVRQLFEERRQKAGIDKSYPLEPINGKHSGKTGVINGARLPNARQPVNTNSRKTVQSTVSRTVTHIRNDKPIVNKRETIQKIYNNNNGIEKYEENHFNENFLDQQVNLVDMMNKNNIYDNLDDEESPPLESGEDDLYHIGKLTNVGGIPPSQNGYSVKVVSDKSKPAPPVIKQTSPIKQVARKSPLKSQISDQKTNPANQVSSRTGSSTHSSPQHPKMTTTAKPAATNRTPGTNMPSSKQVPPRSSAMSSVVRDDLQQCNYCGRRFAADRVQTHEEICSKTNKKQRKAYDAFKHRVQGTEAETFTGTGKKKGGMKAAGSKKSTAPPQANKGNWRRTHEEFIATIRSAKMAQAHLASGGKLSDLPPPPPSSNPDYVQCPSCGRRFNEAAAQRHIPKCATYEYNKPKPGAAKKR